MAQRSARFRAPRRLRVLRAGAFLIAGAVALGLATLNTGNNLLYLLLGALLGTIALSGWLSEQAVRHVRVRRAVPRGAHAGAPIRIDYTVLPGRRRRLPAHVLRLQEAPASGRVRSVPAWVAVGDGGHAARARGTITVRRRGIHALGDVVVATSFPFGLFTKERTLHVPGTLVVWPRTDRVVRQPAVGGARGLRAHRGGSPARGGERGDYRGLREFRSGDDPRDIHWRTTARRGAPVVREYDRDAADEYWIVLDEVAPDARAGESAVEVAAALIVQAAARGDRFGLAAGAARIPPGPAAGRVEPALDVLAAVALRTSGGAPPLPAPPHQCVLVTARGAAPAAWGDVFVVPPFEDVEEDADDPRTGEAA